MNVQTSQGLAAPDAAVIDAALAGKPALYSNGGTPARPVPVGYNPPCPTGASLSMGV